MEPDPRGLEGSAAKGRIGVEQAHQTTIDLERASTSAGDDGEVVSRIRSNAGIPVVPMSALLNVTAAQQVRTLPGGEASETSP